MSQYNIEGYCHYIS